MRTKVALIFGGRSLEKDISVITAMQALNNIDRSVYDVEPMYLQDGCFYAGSVGKLSAFTPFKPEEHVKTVLLNGSFYSIKKDKLTRRFKPDVAFLCCHGGEGENGTLQAILDFNGIPYASSGILGSAIGMDKAIAKELFENMLMNVIQNITVFRGEFEADSDKVLFHLESFLCYPLIVKPATLGSSIGIRVASNRDELAEAIKIACEFDEKIIVEQKLTDFIEVNCAAFRDGEEIVLSETEQPLSANDFLTFEDKYMENGKMSGGGHKIPAEIGALNAVVRSNTERVYRELGLEGIVRVDYLVDEQRNKVYINEINTIPGSLAFYLFEPTGISMEQLISKQIENALRTAVCRRRYRTEYKTGVLEKFKGGSKIQKQ